MKHALFASIAALSVLSVAAPAAGHSVLTSPAPLTQDDNAKSGPCGCYFGGGPETPAEDGSPSPCPADFAVTTLQAGTQLTVKWLETVNHNGDFRIAISPKSPAEALKADMDGSVVMEIPDQNGTSGAEITAKIIVPDTPCELCTLQLRQFMIGAAQPYYYSCAAVKIVGSDPTGSSSGAGGDGGSGGGSGNGGGGNGAGGAGNGAGGPSGAGGEAGSTGAGMADPQPKIEDGCSVSGGAGSLRGSAGGPFAGLAIVGLSLLAGFSRRRRRG